MRIPCTMVEDEPNKKDQRMPCQDTILDRDSAKLFSLIQMMHGDLRMRAVNAVWIRMGL